MPVPPDAFHRKDGGSPKWTVALACVPVLALTLGIPFADRLEPRVFGLPFLLAWIVAWILLTPAIMATVHWLDRRR